MFREPEKTKLVETDILATAPTDDDEVSMDVQKCYGAKDTSGPLSSANPPISVAATNHFHPTWTQDMSFQTKFPPLHNQMSTH